MAILSPMLVMPMMLLLLFTKISSSTDTITQSQSLPDDGSTLVSKDGTFELGYFNPGNSPNRYIGIWYRKISLKTIVWVANRDNPIQNKTNSSKLIINQTGNLVLLDQNNSPLWSTNTTKKSSTPIVQLLDNGNLVLRDEKNDTEESFSWQSFDYPTDTILPGMKAGVNKKTGLRRLLTAWKNWEDPSSSDLTSTMVVTPNPESYIWNGENIYYRTGPWTGPRSSGVIGLTNNPVYDYEFVNNENEVYYMFTMKTSSLISVIVLNRTLSVRQRLIWNPDSRTWNAYQTLPQDSCDVYNQCKENGVCSIGASPMCQCLEGFVPKSLQQWNALDWSQGCVRSGNWSCGVKNRDGFRKISGMKLPDTTRSWIDEKMTLNDCRDKCSENCSCTAYSSLDSSGAGAGCSIWFGDLIDLRVSPSGQDLYVRIDTSEEKNGHRKKVVLAVSIPVSITLVMILAFFIYIYINKAKQRGNIEETTWTEGGDEGEHEDFDLPIIDLATIQKATDNFSIHMKLGEGGFGPVYKGILPDGQEIAVKRLSRSSGQGLKEFKNEVILCAKLQHRNLVKVVGCCIEGEEKMLLYEYMPNRSLDVFLFDPIQSKLLDWSMRFNILYGIARGLLYLHQDSRLRIIHRDLKVSNILLDNNMNPKISDFGMARMCGGDQIDGRTNRIVGTYGYMAPEYAIDGLFSIKSDVFSFGVLILEIISGRKNRALTSNEQDDNLIRHVWKLWKDGIPLQLVDDCLGDSYILSEVLRCIQIGLLCLQHHPDDRPNMASLVVMLSSENALPQPKEPGFLMKKVSIEGKPSSGGQTSSVNEVTISLLDAR